MAFSHYQSGMMREGGHVAPRRAELELRMTSEQERLRNKITQQIHVPALSSFHHKSPEIIRRDTTEEKMLAQKFATGKNPFGEMAEQVLHVSAKEACWFGSPDHVQVHSASAYDDFKHGVDALVEWNYGSNPLVLAVDFTTVRDPINIDAKLSPHPEYRKDTTTVDYFRSGFLQDTVRNDRLETVLEQIPRVVLGVDLGVQNDGLQDLAKTILKVPEGIGKAMRSHVYRSVLLDQAYGQIGDMLTRRFTSMMRTVPMVSDEYRRDTSGTVTTAAVNRDWLFDHFADVTQEVRECGLSGDPFILLVRIAVIHKKLEEQRDLIKSQLPSLPRQAANLMKYSALYKRLRGNDLSP